jgi:hypothetical protein
MNQSLRVEFAGAQTLRRKESVLRISTARRVADIFWPDFTERDGVILLSYVRPPEPRADPAARARVTNDEPSRGLTEEVT